MMTVANSLVWVKRILHVLEKFNVTAGCERNRNIYKLVIRVCVSLDANGL